MNSFETLEKTQRSENSRLYEFLASSYDISNLASKLYAQKSAKLNIMNLKKISQKSA